MDILEHPTEWLIPDQAVELAHKGLEEAFVFARHGKHLEAARAFEAVITGLKWQVMHQEALAISEEQ